MTRAKDLSGMRFGKLAVIERSGSNRHGKALWLCRCECGQFCNAISGNLISGGAQSCGCSQKEAASKTLSNYMRIDIVGSRFGRLVVTRLHERDHRGVAKWACICDCGNEHYVITSHLQKGRVKSCGCLLSDVSRAKLFKHGLSRTKQYLSDKAKRKYERDKKDPLNVAKSRARSLIQKSLSFSGYRKDQKASKILGCTYDEFRRHIERQFCDGMSWDRWSEIHIDHIIPMASARSADDALKLCHFTNLRPLWAKDNIKKGSNRLFLI